MAGVANWQAKITIDVEDLKKRITEAEGELNGITSKDHKIKLDLDTKTLENAVKKLDRMLESLGKGTDDFKQFENLSKQLSSITSDINNISRAFSSMNDGSELVNNIKSIDASLSTLSQHFVTEVSGKMATAIKDTKATLADVGDGKELTPLLQTIGKIEGAIKELTTSVKGVNLNMNIDLGSDDELKAKVEAKTAGVLHAYEKLFSQIKQSGQLSQAEQGIVDNFNIGDFDGMEAKISEYERVIKELRATQKSVYGKDYLRNDIDKNYWTAVSGAKQALSLAKKSGGQDNVLQNVFGGTDLSEVIVQLTTIAGKLDNIVSVSQELKASFTQGLNVNTSVEEITKLTDRVKELESELAKIKTPTTLPSNESNISSGSNPAIEQQNKLQEELKETQQQAEKSRQSISELVKGRDVVSQNWYREKGTVVGKDSKGNDITRDADEFSFVERLKNGQLQTVLATYNEETGKWAEQIINVRTAFEQVEKAIISADNKIASLEMAKEKALAAHPGYDATADDKQIAIERKKRDELQNTLNLYGQEKEYVFEIEAATKRIADNLERLNNKKQSQTNLRQAVSDEQLLKDWDAAIAENNKREAESAKQQAKSINEEWTNAFKVVKEYESAVTKLNNLKASDRGLGTKSNEIAEQEKKIDDMKSSFEAAQTTLLSFFSSIDKFNSIPISSIKEVQDVIKLIQTAANGSTESLAKLEDALRNIKTNQFKKIDDKFGKYSKQYTSLENSPAGYDHNDKYKAELEAYDNQLKAIKTKIQAIKDQDIDVVDQKDLSELDKMYTKLDKINDSLSHIPATQKGSTKESRQKVFNMINELKQFTGMAKESKLELEAMEQRFKNLGTNLNVSEAISEVKAFKAQLVATNQTTKNLLDTVKEKAWYGWAAQLAGMFSFYDVINGFRQVTSTVIDLNTQITELAKVSEQSSKQIYDDFSSYADIAKEVRGTISDTIVATADWSKNGYSIPDSKQLAEVSQLYKNVGDGINIDEANESLISTLQGFKLEADQAEHIVDVFNEVSNNEAISSGGIGEALQRSAASFNAANTELEKSVALVTATRLHRLVEYMETYIENIFNCHRSLYYYVPQYRG